MTKHAEHIAKVKEIIYGQESLVAAKDIYTRVKQEMAEIQRDPALSAIGIAQKQREAQARAGVELAKIMRENKKQIDAELAAAEKIARAALTQPNAKPDEEVLRDFNEKYGQLKTELVVFGSAQAAAKMLDFMAGVKDPYLAKQLADDFATTGVELRKHVGDQMRLRTVYEGVKAKAETDSRALAKKALEEIESLRTMKPINSMVTLGSESALGDTAREVIANHEGFLRSHGE
ncbi:hypothetical protein NST08_24590 [Paenibacillus sp. FSL K6-1566]|uniref:hypothetical protein n=1 Tax=Paenibacillus sp. FSL K6-1566 TaxID=2954515 RepID=UPI003100FD7B